MIVRMGTGQSSSKAEQPETLRRNVPASHQSAQSASGMPPDSPKQSPHKLRKTFVPDRGGDFYRPGNDPPYRRTSRSRSPPTFRSDRRSRPFRRESSPPHLSSSPPRAPQSGSRASGEFLHEPLHRSILTWKAPQQVPNGKPPAPPSTIRPVLGLNASSPPETTIGIASTDTGADRIDFHSLKSVPTGPRVTEKKSQPKLQPATLPERVESDVRQHPHIFISDLSLPADMATIKHLYGFLRSYLDKLLEICVDRSGYYLVFERSGNGVDFLERCFQQHNGAKLFSMYTLNMECFPDGEQAGTPGIATLKDSSQPHLNTTDGCAATADMCLSPPAPPCASGLHTSASATSKRPISSERLPSIIRSNSATADSLSRTEVVLEPRRKSSPPRVPSRQDKDDSSSSISGLTSSDMSGTKRSKCHVCETPSSCEADTLVKCSSCPRKYHRRCHAKPTIPTDLGDGNTWQCRRCVKRQVHPRSRLSNTSFAVTSPAPSVGQDEEPLLKKRKLVSTDAQPPRPKAVAIATESATETPEEFYSGPNAFLPPNTMSVENCMAEQPPLNSDDRNQHAADDLVEQSFASLTEMPQTPANQGEKRRKLNLVRRKIQPLEDHQTTSAAREANSVESTSNAEASRLTLAEPQQPPRHPGADAERPKRKPKSHRWIGGGADKDIIQAGVEKNVLSRKDKGTPSTSSPASKKSTFDKPAAAVFDAGGDAQNQEVPESPEEARNLTNKEAPRAPDMNIINQSNGQQTYEKTPTQDRPESRAPREQMQGLSLAAPHRVKPSHVGFDRCTRCNKKIAFNPSGTKKLCSTCKKAELAPKAASPDVTSAHGYLDNTSLTNDNQAHNTISKVQNNVRITDQSLVGDHSSGDQPDVTGARSFSQKKSEMAACDKCRKAHRRCDHHPVTNSRNAREVSGQHQVMQPVDLQDQPEEAEDDLDLWTSRPGARRTALEAGNEIIQEDAAMLSQDDSVLTKKDADIEMQDVALPNAKPRKNRKSQTTRPVDDFDLGNSYQRPKGTYEKLIGMALCAAPEHAGTGNEVVQWVADNIPGYGLNEDSWQSGLKATMIFKRQGYNGCKGLWKVVDEGRAKTHGFTYQLLPGEVDRFAHLAPKRKINRSLATGHCVEPRTDKSGERARNAETSIVPSSVQSDPRLKASPGQSDLSAERKHVKQRHTAACTRFQATVEDEQRMDMETEVVVEDGNASRDAAEQMDDTANNHLGDVGATEPEMSIDSFSDEEPLVQRSTSKDQPDSALQPVHQQVTDHEEVPNIRRNHEAERRAQESVVIPPENQNRASLPNLDITNRRRELADIIKRDANNRDFSAKSLFEEWPEYDPANYFDREAKIAEIRKRPTRKQRFKTPSVDPWYDPKPSKDASKRHSSMFQSKRASRNGTDLSAYPWENGETSIIHCDTVEELFNLPKNPIAIIQDGQIAYRDGTRNEDGTLPRAKVIYKTGFT